MYGFVDGRFIGNPGLKPERSTGWEAGLEQSVGRQSLVGVTYFDSRLKDEIFTSFPPPDFVASPANRNTKSTQRGIEAFAALRFDPAWRIDAAYTWLRARENGVEETRRARHIASLAVDWRAPGDRGGLNLVARYNGAQADDAFLDPSFIPTRVRLGDYLLVNAGADWALTRGLSLFARAENLLDEEYEQVFSFTNPGRAVYAGLKARL